MAKKVETKKTVKKTTTKKAAPKKKVVKKVEVKEEKKVIKPEEIEEEVIDFEEFDDEEDVVVKRQYKEKKKLIPRRKKKEDVLGDSLLRQNAEIINFFKILIAVLVFIGLFYLMVSLLRGEIGHKKDTKREEQETTIQNQEILGSDVFTKEDKEYYVFLFDTSSKKVDFYFALYNDYLQTYPVISMFYVDLNNKFNKDIVSEETNKKAQKYSELKVSSPTLIHIKNGKNIGYYEGEDVTTQMIKLNK